MSTYGDEVTAIDVALTAESTPQGRCHLHCRRNSLTSPLLRLPTELILTIIEYAIQPDDNDDIYIQLPPLVDSQVLLALTVVCHQLRRVAMTPHLWGHVDLSIHPLAKFSLELCNYDPHCIKITWSEDRDSRWVHEVSTETRDRLLELEAHPLGNLRSLAFGGGLPTFTELAVPILQRANNIAKLEFCYPYNFPSDPEHPWLCGANHMPNLSTLRLHGFSISWTSPLLRNLRHLYLQASRFSAPSVRGPLKMFLAALASCPDLEELTLSDAGPDLATWHQEDQGVVQLQRLRKLHLWFHDPFVIGCVLSHIEYRKSIDLQVEIRAERVALWELVHPTLLHQKIQAIQCSRKSRLSVEFSNWPKFSTDIFHLRFLGGFAYPVQGVHPRVWLRLAPKIMETVGRNKISSFAIRMRYTDLAEEILKEFLHGLPQLERIDYHPLDVRGDRDSIDPFLSVFSEPFEGSPVCPRLRDLRLDWEVLTLFSSVMILKHALEERDVQGIRLRQVAFVGARGDGLFLEPFRDVVDEVLPL